MSQVPKRYCVFGCDHLVTFGVPLHRFPNPEKHPDRFALWITAIGNEKIKKSDPKKVYNGRRVCDHHFDPLDKISGRRLKQTAIPSINLKGVRQSFSTFAETDHCYSHALRESIPSRHLMDITNLPGPSTQIVHQSNMTEVLSPIPLPSGSTDTTCVVVADQSEGRKPCTRFNAEKTFKFLKNKTSRNYTRKMRQKENEIRRLRQKVKCFKLRLRELEKLTNKISFERFTENMSVSGKLFTRMQCMEGGKKKKGHRFTLEEKILSLSFYKKSPKAYKLMCKHFTLPSRKILKSLLSQIVIKPGINDIVFKELKSTVSKLKPQDRLCTLIFDEMSISPQLFYNSYTDDIVGFEHFGDEKTSKFANHALVFMVKGVRKNFKQPVAYFFTQSLTTIKLKEIITEVITNVQATGLTIIATVCDQGAPNPSAINKLILEGRTERDLNKENNNDVIFINNCEIIPLFDVPHLLKGIRNNLLNKEIIYKDKQQIKIVKWEYFQRIYAADKSHGELRLLPKITREHVDPSKLKKMRVKNAAQLFSHSMAVAADNLVARGDLPTECQNVIPFVIIIDKLFDSLNASSFTAPRGKKYRAAVKRHSPHHELWEEALQMLKSIQFMVKRGDGTTYKKHVPTINNFIKTVEGFKSLWQLLSQKYRFDTMLTRHFNQDPLENFFGSIRSLGARNVAPNCMGFEGAFKTLLLNNMSSDHSINSNCEEDSGKCLQSLSFFIKNKVKNSAPSQSQNIVIDKPLDVVQNTPSNSGSDQTTYVCGWALVKCLQKVVKGCVPCKSKLLGNSKNEKYRYIHAKEFEKDKEWLCYPSDCLVACFKEIQSTTIAFLNSECYKIKIKERIIAFVDMFTDFSFMDCDIHKYKLRECFVNTTINIIIYSWCRSVNRILEGKIIYEGDDAIKKAAQIYHNRHKSIKK